MVSELAILYGEVALFTMDYINILVYQVRPFLYKPYVMLIGVEIDDLLLVQQSILVQILYLGKFKKNQVVAQSSTEAEYKSLTQVTTEILWF